LRPLEIGEEVLGRDGSRLGALERLVVDERAHAVTHLVVAGRVVGARYFADDEEGRLVCDLDHAGLEAQPDLEHASVAGVPDHWQPPRGYVLGSFLRIAEALVGQTAYVPPVAVEPDRESAHEITAGSPVWSAEHRLGEVTRVLTDDFGTVTDLVVRHGALDEEVRLPADRVTEVIGNNVHTDLGPPAFAELPRYDGGA
jgi:hypothetical protein